MSAPAPDADSISSAQVLFEIIKIILTAILSIVVTGLLLQRWQYKEEFIEGRIVELIGDVDAAADKAIEYWKSNQATPPSVDNRALEADIFARQMRIARTRASLGGCLDQNSMKDLFTQEGKLFSACSGGAFGNSDRLAEPARFMEIRGQAGNYINRVRDGRAKRMNRPWRQSLKELLFPGG